MAISALSTPIQFSINIERAYNDRFMEPIFKKKEKFYLINKLIYQDLFIKITENITYFLKEQSEELPTSFFRKVFNNNIIATFAIFVISAYICNKSMENKIKSKEDIIPTVLEKKLKDHLKLINFLLKRKFIDLKKYKKI